MKMGFNIFVRDAKDEISENHQPFLNAKCFREIGTISTH